MRAMNFYHMVELSNKGIRADGAVCTSTLLKDNKHKSWSGNTRAAMLVNVWWEYLGVEAKNAHTQLLEF